VYHDEAIHPNQLLSDLSFYFKTRGLKWFYLVIVGKPKNPIEVGQHYLRLNFGSIPISNLSYCKFQYKTTGDVQTFLNRFHEMTESSDNFTVSDIIEKCKGNGSISRAGKLQKTPMICL